MIITGVYISGSKDGVNKDIWEKLLEYTKQEPDLEIAIIDDPSTSAEYKKDSGAQEALGPYTLVLNTLVISSF